MTTNEIDGASGASPRTGDVLAPDEALRRLQQGEVVTDCRITGLRLCGSFEHPVDLRRCHLERFTVEKATFAQGLSLRGCVVARPRIHRSEVQGDLLLQGLHTKRLMLRALTVTGRVCLDGMRSRAQFGVVSSRFGGLTAWGAEFGGWVEIKDLEVTGSTDMRSVTCAEGMDLRGCTFGGEVLFRGMALGKKLDLADCRFEGLLDLSRAKLPDFVYLTGIRMGEDATLAFANALADKMHVDFGQVVGRLQSERERNFGTAAAEYALLKSNYQSLHRFEDEDRAFYAFRVSARKAKAAAGNRFGALLEWFFLDLGCGYGANPWKAVRAALVSIVLFAALFFAAGPDMLQGGQGIDLFADGKAMSSLEWGVFALAKSVSVFTAGLAGDQLLDAKGWVLLPLAVEALLGTFLWGLFIVAFGRKVIR